MRDTTKQAIDKIYRVFGTYEIGDLEKISCFDCGPSQAELLGVTKDLRDIPQATVDTTVPEEA